MRSRRRQYFPLIPSGRPGKTRLDRMAAPSRQRHSPERPGSSVGRAMNCVGSSIPPLATSFNLQFTDKAAFSMASFVSQTDAAIGSPAHNKSDLQRCSAKELPRSFSIVVRFEPLTFRTRRPGAGGGPDRGQRHWRDPCCCRWRKPGRRSVLASVRPKLVRAAEQGRARVDGTQFG